VSPVLNPYKYNIPSHAHTRQERLALERTGITV